MSRRLAAWLLPMLALMSPGVLLQLYFAGNWYAFFDSYSLGMFFGLAAFVWFGLTLMLSARIRVLDRLFGHDRVLLFHGYLALTSVLFACTHAVLKYVYFGLGTLQVTIGIVSLSLFFAVSTATILFMVSGRLQRLKLLARLRAFAVTRLGFDYSRLKLFHNMVSVACLCMVVHVLMAPATAESYLRMSMVGGFGIVSLAVYVQHKFVRPLLRARWPVTVQAVQRLSDDVVELRLSAGPKRRHRAGQFVYLRLPSRICGQEEHPFTLSSPPRAEGATLTIKALGDYTARVATVEPGTRAILDGPYGRFAPRRDVGPLLFVAGGIGITPFLAILREWDAAELVEPVTLVWSVRRESDFVDQGFFDGLAARHERFRYVPIVTRPESESRSSARIDKALLAKAVGTPAQARLITAYLCGPELMQRAVRRWLREMGIPADAIHDERFSS